MRIGNGQFFIGDCFDIMRDLPDGSADMVLADLPYGTTQNKWDSVLPLDRLWTEYRRLCGGPVVLTAAQPFTSALVMSNLAGFKHEWIWHKSKSGSSFTAKFRPMAKHESVLVFGKGRLIYNPQMMPGEPYSRTRRPPPINNHQLGLGRNGDSTTVNTGTRYPDSVQFFRQQWRRQDQLHPTQKPVELFEYLIRSYTDEGMTVLDNTAGSGTTAIAAENAGRHWICIEKDEAYAAKAIERINKHVDGW